MTGRSRFTKKEKKPQTCSPCSPHNSFHPCSGIKTVLQKRLTDYWRKKISQTKPRDCSCYEICPTQSKNIDTPRHLLGHSVADGKFLWHRHTSTREWRDWDNAHFTTVLLSYISSCFFVVSAIRNRRAFSPTHHQPC